ncbi:MAG: hypothetical protein ACSHX0_02440 [Akkermansiaceae bacterium]
MKKTLLLGIALLSNCNVPSGHPAGAATRTIDQAGGGQHVSVAPGVYQKKATAVEAFHMGVQKDHPSGSYRYVCKVQKQNHARTSAGQAIPFGAGPAIGGGMLLGNIIQMQQAQPSTFSVTGKTSPQAVFTVSKNTPIDIKVSTSEYAIQAIDKKHLAELRSSIIAACKNRGLSPKNYGKYLLHASLLRFSDEEKWLTVEMVLRLRGSQKVNKGFLITTKENLEQELQKTITQMILVN